eukprot:g25020.t1
MIEVYKIMRGIDRVGRKELFPLMEGSMTRRGRLDGPKGSDSIADPLEYREFWEGLSNIRIFKCLQNLILPHLFNLLQPHKKLLSIVKGSRMKRYRYKIICKKADVI